MLIVAPKINFTESDINQTLKVGNTTNLPINFIGNPKPNVTWTLNNDTLQESENINVTVGTDHSIVEVKKATMKEKGKYRVEAKNDIGSDSVTFNIAVVGKHIKIF